MTVKWLNVKASEAVEHVGYDQAHLALHVVYAGGREYAYYGVPPQEVKALTESDSVGQFVNFRIKPRYTNYRDLGAARRPTFARRTFGPTAHPADRGAHR